MNLIEQISEEARELKLIVETIGKNLALLDEPSQPLFEAATHVLGGMVDRLEAGRTKEIEEQNVNIAAAIIFLADDTSRATITDHHFKGDSSKLIDLLKNAGDNDDANNTLIQISKKYGQSILEKLKGRLNGAIGNPNKEKQLAGDLRKYRAAIEGLRPTDTSNDPKKDVDVRKWFK